MRKRIRRTTEPHLFLSGDQPHIYGKSKARRLEVGVEDTHDRHMHLTGDQPHFSRRHRVSWKKVAKWGSLGLAAALIVFFVLGYIWLKTKESQMRVPAVQEVLSPKQSGQSETTLVMGVDRGSVKGEAGPGRSDIMMLVSVSSDGKKAAVISIPRDTRLILAGHSGYNKINAAHSFGGTKGAIETVSNFTNLEINHFVEIDFEGFKRIVNAMGGVRMQIDNAIDDKYAGHVPAGDVVLNGDQALALVRARYDVKAVPGGDLDRIKNQQKFIQAMLSTVSHQRNPFKVRKIIDAASENVKTDLSFMQMFSLGRKLKGIGNGSVEMTTAPGSPKVIGGVWYYIVDRPQFDALLESVKAGTIEGPTTTQPQVQANPERSGTKVRVLNGSGQAGLAGEAAAKLSGKGYAGVTTGNASSHYEQTTIYYSGNKNAVAGLVAADLEGAGHPLLKPNDSLTTGNGVDVLVVLGADYHKG